MHNIITSFTVILFSLITVSQLSESSSLENRAINLRVQRQSDCFQCTGSNECIDRNAQCDGIVDCKDGSDEGNICKDISCPAYTFKCNYGACIDSNLRCNGVKDCRDGSDEGSCQVQ